MFGCLCTLIINQYRHVILFCSWRISIKMAADEVSELLRTFETAFQDIERKLQSGFADNADFV